MATGNITSSKATTKDTPLAQSAVGKKADEGKLDWALLPLPPTEEVIKVLMFGAAKYSPHNWKRVPDSQRRYYNAACRHITAWQQGELLDKESGKHHLAHAICCLMFLLHADLEAAKPAPQQ